MTEEQASPTQYRRVWEIHQMLVPKPDDLISTHRFFVREGPIMMYSDKERKKKQRYLFLFNDVMLICKKAPKQKWRVKVHVTLRSSHVSTEEITTTGYEAQFRVHCRTRSFNFYASSNEERAEWLADLNKSISGGYTTEEIDKQFIQKEKELANAPEPTDIPPADLKTEKKSRSRSQSKPSPSARPQSSRDGLNPKKSESPRKSSSSRDGLSKKDAPANTNPRAKSSNRQHRMTVAAPSVVGNPSQWDPLAASAANNRTAALISPRMTHTSPSSYHQQELIRSAGGTPSSPFDSFITQSQPGYTQPFATAAAANPFSPRPNGGRPVSMMIPSSNPFTTNSNPFNTGRASVNFGDPNAGLANPFTTNQRATVNFGSSVPSSFGSAGISPINSHPGLTNTAPNPFATVNPILSPTTSAHFGNAQPAGTTTNNPFLVDNNASSPFAF